MAGQTARFSGADTTVIRGIRASKCSVCHEVFSGESTYVLHRIEPGKVSARPGRYLLGHCRDPLTKGMALNTYGVWSLPTDPNSSLAGLNVKLKEL